MWVSVYSLSLILSCLSFSTQAIRVQLSTGDIEGRTLTATYSPFGNQTARVFFGIPYASPPIGSLRFQKPRPPRRWDGIMPTKLYKPACMSNAEKTYKTDDGGPISEDCLYANVFTSDYCRVNRNCSVMIAIHGGGFLFESASAFDPLIFINNFVGQDRNIVAVTINYRLGVFGFGQFNGDAGVSGDRNIALHDCLAAIKWVRREIGAFGGNKDRITIIGHSAGAALTFLIGASPLSKGLIHQQVIMSGPLPNMSPKSNYKAMTAVAWHLGCLNNGSGFGRLPKNVIEDTYACLRKVPAQELLDAQLYILNNATYYLGAPFIDGEFITNYPDVMFDEKLIFPVNTMIGTTSAELRETIFIKSPQNAQRKDRLLRNVCEHIGYEIYDEPEVFSEKCFEFYKNGDDVQYLSDDQEFYTGTMDTANAHLSKNTSVFLYSYTYSGAGAAFSRYLPDVPSPHHSEDLIYVFGTHRAVMAPKDYVIERIYSGMFANFINFGDPSPSEEQKWTPYSKEKREFFLIDFDEKFTMPGMQDHYYQRALDFWSSSGFRKHHKDEWAPSLDTFIITNLVSPITGHLAHNTTDTYKSFEQSEILFAEREAFLVELKAKRKLEMGKGGVSKKSGGIQDEGKELGKEEEDEGGINILLLIFAGTLLIGIFYLSITHFCMHRRSREGYQLLK